MVTLNVHFDGKATVPDEPVALELNQKLRITIEPLDPAPAEPVAGRQPKRVFGQQKGAVLYIAPDFNDHLGGED